jgi:uncharacterized protein YndB with AHSA1/START domain
MGEPERTEHGLVVRESIRVDVPTVQAFRLFTEGIGEWWPLDEGYAHGGDRAREIFLEPVEGGRFFERLVDGDELQVGTVLVCSPPQRIVFTWRSQDWVAATEVDVRFTPLDDGTMVQLEHRGWDRLGPDGDELARRYASGWPRVVQAFAERARMH